ncbi:MAG: VWA domain-containing protein [Pyrinomonadaceae bacterium]|nr:VWA domain-containing protein [Pyrinomonadaceae bacterium]
MPKKNKRGFTMRRATLKDFYACAALFVLCFVYVTLPQSADAQEDDAGRGLRFDLPRNARLRVENLRGDVTVETWNEKYVALESAANEPEPPVRIGRTNQLLTVSTLIRPGTRRARTVNLKLHVPTFARLQITTAKGKVEVRGLPQSLVAQTTTGNVLLEIPAASDALITAQSRRGQIVSTLDENKQNPRTRRRILQTRLGAGNKIVRLTSLSGRITLAPLAMENGDVAATTNTEQPPVLERPQATPTPNVSVTAPSPTPEEVDEDDVIRVETDLVTLNMSVVDRTSGRGVVGLAESDFKIYEDGTEQTIRSFESSSAPFDLMLLIDLSGSTRDVVNLIRTAALRFVRAARPQDRIAVVTFAAAPVLVAPPTTDRADLRRRINAMEQPQGSTKLYDAMNFALDLIEKNSANKRRSAVILMSDGLDSSLPNVRGDGSSIPYSDILHRTEELDGVLYSLWLNTEYEAFSPEDVQPETVDTAYERMNKLAEAGGGVFYEVERLEDLAGVYERVVADIGTVYTFTYLPTDKKRDGRWRGIRVTVPQRPNLIVRGRRGYRLQ